MATILNSQVLMNMNEPQSKQLQLPTLRLPEDSLRIQISKVLQLQIRRISQMDQNLLTEIKDRHSRIRALSHVGVGANSIFRGVTGKFPED